MSDYIYDSTVVDTDAGRYRIDVIPDTDPLPPEYYGCGIAYAGTQCPDQYQNATGDDADDILSLIRFHSASNQNIWDRERRSPAALARYVPAKIWVPSGSRDFPLWRPLRGIDRTVYRSLQAMRGFSLGTYRRD